MCGRFTMHTPSQAVLSHFHLPASSVQLDLRFNIAPTQLTPVVRSVKSGQRELAEMRWGLIPFWTDEPGKGPPLINARSESAAIKPTFRAAFRQRRCLVPSDGFFEWERRGKRKLPHYFQMRDERLFAYAGLWESCESRQDGTLIESYTILTTSANELTSSVHDRMPVILDEADYDMWLDPEFEVREPLESLMRPYSSEEMKMQSVSTRVNSVRNDDAACLEVQQELF